MGREEVQLPPRVRGGIFFFKNRQYCAFVFSISIMLKLLVLSCLVNLAFSATVQVPAGINPADCPGYPNCPFYLLTNNRPANQPADTVYELCPGYPICDNAALHNAAGPALSAPAGVDISKCPGYPFQQCN